MALTPAHDHKHSSVSIVALSAFENLNFKCVKISRSHRLL